MRRHAALATGITAAIAAGLVATALAAAPALAQGPQGPGGTTTSTSCTCVDGTAGPGAAEAPRRRGGAAVRGTGAGADAAPRGAAATAAPAGTLTVAQQTALARMAEDEKAAYDLYTALAVKYPDLVQFSRIARAEATHLSAVRSLLTRYGIADPTAGLPAGTFADAEVQALYSSLLSGATSAASALAAGVTVEKTDIADLTTALSGVSAPDVTRVLTQLLNGSQRHLVAFGG